MLLPIETKHDTAANTVSATTDCLGTYCHMEIWLDSLGIEPKNKSIDESGHADENGGEVRRLDENTTSYADYSDVVFMIDSVMCNSKNFTSILSLLPYYLKVIYLKKSRVLNIFEEVLYI